MILDLLPEFGVAEKKTHSSSIDEDVAHLVRKRLGVESEPPAREDEQPSPRRTRQSGTTGLTQPARKPTSTVGARTAAAKARGSDRRTRKRPAPRKSSGHPKITAEPRPRSAAGHAPGRPPIRPPLAHRRRWSDAAAAPPAAPAACTAACASGALHRCPDRRRRGRPQRFRRDPRRQRQSRARYCPDRARRYRPTRKAAGAAPSQPSRPPARAEFTCAAWGDHCARSSTAGAIDARAAQTGAAASTAAPVRQALDRRPGKELAGQPAARPVVPPRPDLVARLSRHRRKP